MCKDLLLGAEMREELRYSNIVDDDYELETDPLTDGLGYSLNEREKTGVRQSSTDDSG